jgi:hypothetical protein
MNIIKKIKNYFHLLRYRGFKEKKQYSKCGEDLFLNDYFKNTYKGSYIDLGAFHPFRGSNTHFLYKKGWSGINIDLNKESIDLFKLARPTDINLNLAISDVKQKIKTYKNKNLGIMNTINPKFASIFLKNFYIKEVFSYTLNDVLDKYTVKNKKIELIDIDAEGSEHLILKNLDFEKYRFKLILVESHKFNEYFAKETEKVHKLLTSKNYSFLKQLGETSVYENQNFN